MAKVTQEASNFLPDLSGTLLDNTGIRLVSPLGQGSWGVVYSAQLDHAPYTRYAVKITDRRAYQARVSYDMEAELHYEASKITNRVVKFYGAYEDEETGFQYLITELCCKGDLRTRLETEWGCDGDTPGTAIWDNVLRSNDDLLRSYFLQIIDGVNDLHANGIFHRDLKCDNIFLKDDDTVVLGDFGFAHVKPCSKSFGTGSAPYMSPECHNEFRRRSCFSLAQSDIWSVGMIMFITVCGKFPWSKPSLEEHRYRKFATIDEDIFLHHFDISPEFNEILKKVLSIDPKKRASLEELRQQIVDLPTFGSGNEKKSRRSKASTSAPAPVPAAEVKPAVVRESVSFSIPVFFEDSDSDFPPAIIDSVLSDDIGPLFDSDMPEPSPLKSKFSDDTSPTASMQASSLADLLATLESTLQKIPQRHTQRSRDKSPLCHEAPLLPSSKSGTSSSSEDDEGPITPETFPVDGRAPPPPLTAVAGKEGAGFQVFTIEDVPLLSLNPSSRKSAPIPIHAPKHEQLVPETDWLLRGV